MSGFKSKTIIYVKTINICKKLKSRCWSHTSTLTYGLYTKTLVSPFKNTVKNKKGEKKGKTIARRYALTRKCKN